MTLVVCSDGVERDSNFCVELDGEWYTPDLIRHTYDDSVSLREDCVHLFTGDWARRDDPELVSMAGGAWGLRDSCTCIDGEWYDSDDCCDCCTCGRSMHNDESSSSPEGTSICEPCREDYTSDCECCGVPMWTDEQVYDDEEDRYICQRCASRERSLIKGYGDKSANNKRPESKDALLYGVELEVEHKVDSERGAKYASKFLDKDYVTFKRDGSLGHAGFEIVTRPDSIAVHKRKFKAMFDDRPGREMTSWSNGRCGMHVHITKSALSQLQLGKMLCFLNEPANVHMISKIAGRKPGRWCRAYKKKISDVNRPDDRYVALNITSKTAECRIFRGTLSQAGFFKNLEFVQALVEFCSPANRGIREAVSAKEFCRWLPRKSYPTLHKFLVERGFIVWNHRRKAA